MRALRRIVSLAALLTAASAAPAGAVTIDFGGTQSTYRPAEVTVAGGETVTFSGKFFDHPLAWDFHQFPVVESGTERSYTGFGPGTHRFYCVAHGSAGGNGMSGIVRVPGNTPPTVTGVTASTSTPMVGQSVTFAAQGAADGDGTITDVEWDFEGDGFFEQRTSTLSVTRSYAVEGPRTVRARVYDNGHDPSDAVTVNIDVSPSTGGPVVAFGGIFGNAYSPADLTGAAGEAVTFEGGFAAHPLEWDFADRPVQASGSSLRVTGLAPGTYRFFCRLHGGAGGSGMSGRLIIEGNERPTVGPLSASPAQPTVGEAVTVSLANASDTDGAITHAEWDLDGNGTYERRTTGLETSTTFETPGPRVVRGRVLDNGHDASAPVERTIDVRAGEAPPPVTRIAFGGGLGLVYDPADVTVPAGQEVVFEGSFEGHPLLWDFGDRPRRGTGNTYTVSPGLAPGTYRYFCELHGAAGGERMAGVLRVPGNAPPSIAGVSAAPAAAAPGETVTFTATGAADSDGTVTHYEWDLDGNGSFERRTETPTTTESYDGSGAKTVHARALDSGHDPSPASETTVTVAAEPGGAPAVPEDRTAPALRILTERLRVRNGAVRIELDVSEAAQLDVQLRRGKVVLGRRDVRAPQSGRLGVRVLVQGRPKRALVVIAARDAAGNTGRVRQTLRRTS